MDSTLVVWITILIVSLIVASITSFRIFGEEKVKNWLVWAVGEAEKQFGSGTGQLKLRSVYNMFVKQFPKLSMIIRFERFSELVDDALKVMRKMLENDKIANVISNNKEE